MGSATWRGEATERTQTALREGIANREELLKNVAPIVDVAELFVAALRAGRKILLCGNGGSAADCQHIAAELTGRFGKELRQALPAIALTTDTSAITAIGNDLGFEQIFARQVEALGQAGDVLVCISTSGKSRNILEAANVGRKAGLVVVGLTGPVASDVGALAQKTITVPGSNTARVQELHSFVGHILCELVEAVYTGALGEP